MSDKELLEQISSKLDIVIGLLAIQNIEDGENAKIRVLAGFGLGPSLIGNMLGMSGNAVSIRLSRMKNAKSS